MHMTARRISMVATLERRALLRNLYRNRKRDRRKDIISDLTFLIVLGKSLTLPEKRAFFEAHKLNDKLKAAETE